MKALWSGDINFGLVTIPVKLFAAVQEKKVNSHLMSPDGKCRLRHKLVCPTTGKEFDFKDAVKGYERSPNEYVLFKKDELSALKAEADSSLEILDFVPIGEIDPRYYDRPYFVAPEKKSIKSYRLLFEAMQKTEKVAIARFVMRRKRYIAAIRPLEDGLALSTLHYENELLSASDIPHLSDLSKATVSSKEQTLGVQLIEQMATHFSAKKYKNEDLGNVSKAVAAREKTMSKKNNKRVSHDDSDADSAPSSRDNVIDLFDSLRRSIHGKDTKATNAKARKTTHKRAAHSVKTTTRDKGRKAQAAVRKGAKAG